MNIKTLCHPEYKRISVESLLNPVEETIDCEKPHSQTKINTAKPISASLYVTTNNTAVVQHNVQKRKGVTRRCPQCNACGLFYRKIFLVFGKDLAKRYFNEIKGVSVKRKVPKSLYGVTRTR